MIAIRRARLEEFEVITSIDDDACQLYASSGVPLGIYDGHPFAAAEQTRWRASLTAGDTFFALDDAGVAQGVAVCGFVDGEPYLDQLSVRLDAMKQGIGTALIDEAARWAREARGADAWLWLTTYGHLDFNRPMYERRGFEVVDEQACPPELVHHLEEQRRWLPAPEHRVAMRRRLAVS